MALSLKELGARITKARKRKGYSQEQLSELAGLSVSQLGRVERGTKCINLITLAQICKRQIATDRFQGNKESTVPG